MLLNTHNTFFDVTPTGAVVRWRHLLNHCGKSASLLRECFRSTKEAPVRMMPVTSTQPALSLSSGHSTSGEIILSVSLKVLICLYLVFASFLSSATSRQNAIYIEGAGAGGWFSLNYERSILRHERIGGALRGGLGTYRLKDYTLQWNPDITLPLSVIFTYGKRHKVEFSLGQTLSNIVQYDALKNKKKRILGTSSHIGIGYRYKAGKGLMIRAIYMPILEFQQNWRHWLGISIGYTF